MSENQVAVIIYNRHGGIDEIFLDSMGNAKKRCLIHNLGHFLDSESTEEDAQIAAKIENLVKENNWEEVFKVWEDENMNEVDFYRPAHWLPFNEAPNMNDLWIYKKST